MLSSDRAESRADQRRRGADTAGCAHADTPWEQAQPFNPNEPWDDLSAEALTRLYESEDGRLSRPAAGDRARPLPARVEPAPADPAGMAEALDRAWLEEHLSRLVERLQATFTRSSPEQSLAALSGRLEAIEQRFGATLGRVAQRADLDSLRSIETHVLELAAQIERARDRMDQIGAVDDEVRALARKVDETGEQRANALEKLLRDCIAEWREGEQRTAGALRNLEEAINRMGDAVEAMEALKPAPDLSVPPLAGSGLGRPAREGGSLFQALDERAPQLYRPLLDAADYAPGPISEESAAAPQPPSFGQAGSDPGRPAGARLTPGALRIMALRAKLRQSPPASREAAPPRFPPAEMDGPPPGTLKRASLSILLMAGAALVAGSSYYLYQTFIAAAPASPVMTERGAHPGQVSGVQGSRIPSPDP